jgi:uroporphyrinogen decarboxylase
MDAPSPESPPRKPDWHRLVDTLWRREPDAVPLADLGVDAGAKQRVLGRPVKNVAADCAFWHKAGYDFISLRPGYEFPDTMPGTTTTGTPHYDEQAGERDERSVSVMGPGVIHDFKDMEGYPWPEPSAAAYYVPLREAAEALPAGMGIVTGVGGIFTRTWMLMGLTEFCCALTERPELVAAIFERVARIQVAVLRRAVKMDRVVAVWYGDDLAYTESSIVSPAVYRKYLFPWMEELASITHAAGMPFAFHSDGRLWDVIPDLVSLGLNALHPIEPKAMDINEVKARYGDRLALIGNIDMDILARGTPAVVRAQVRERIRDLAPGGGYAVGANPGISDYVLPECYDAMRQAALDFGRYPISL